MSRQSRVSICFDTNIVMDLATQRKGWEDSFIAYDVAALIEADCFLLASATTDIAYLLTSSTYKLSAEDAHAALENLFEMFELLDVAPSDATQALHSKMPDYEDALLSFAALRHDCTMIISKNKKDFLDAPLSVATPQEFADAFKPADFSYSLEKLSLC